MGFASTVPWGPPETIPESVRYDVDEPGGGRLGGFTYLDCGTWVGDDRMLPAQRSFGVVCGGTAVLCELAGAEPLARAPREGAPGDVASIERVLHALAGPQGADVRILRWLDAGAGDPCAGERDAREVASTPYLILPEMRLPLVTRMPELDANVVPDPTQATCFCHGPIIDRFLRGASVAGEYRAVGCRLGRDPNEWFYGMTEHFDEVAQDLVKLLARARKVRGSPRPRIVQLGDMFEVWAGFSCCFQASGRAAMVMPRILRVGSVQELRERWLGVTMDTAAQRALRAVAQLREDDITFVPGGGAGGGLDGLGARAGQPGPETHQPPFGLFGLLEQQQVFSPWRRVLDQGGRGAEIAEAVERFRSAGPQGRFRVFASSGSQVPCLTHVSVSR